MHSPAPDADPAAFLAQQLPLQHALLARYPLAGGQVWLKRAGPRHGMGRYRALGAAARLLRLPVLTPVPNLGGRAAIATEVRRLRELDRAGVRVPQVLAACEDGFLMADLGAGGGAPTLALARELANAVPRGPAAVLAPWAQGLDTLAEVHARGLCLSQAFARNMVRCADGRIACLDFEDDPAATLALPVCQLRDALCYVHSTALYLAQAQAAQGARAAWQRWLGQPQYGGEFHALLRGTTARLRWLRHLPADRRLGRDAQRLRAAWDLLSGL